MVIGDFEMQSLQLLSETQDALENALKSIGHPTLGLVERYKLFNAAHINKIVEGYVCLRSSRRFDASKQLVRPAFETFVKLQAIERNPELLFRVAFTERREDKKWLCDVAKADAAKALRDIEADWKQFKRDYQLAYPSHMLIEKEVSFFDLMQCIGWKAQYGTYYRLYCKFTHGAFKAVCGYLDNLAPMDNTTVAICAIGGIEVLEKMGAHPQNFQAMLNKLDALTHPTA